MSRASLRNDAGRRVIVSLGSNVAPRREFLSRALDALSALPATRLVRASTVVETDPEGVPDEFADLKFLNQAAVFETDLGPQEFARCMHAIEDDLGRVRTVRNGPRTIDIDLVDFGGVRMNTPELTLPHPRAAQRDFVLRPLAELGIDRSEIMVYRCGNKIHWPSKGEGRASARPRTRRSASLPTGRSM